VFLVDELQVIVVL